MLHPATTFQFGRAVHEYARWIALAEHDRSAAPAWWWSPAFAVRESGEPMPPEWARMMALPQAVSYAEAAALMLQALAGQAAQPWPEEFPRRYRSGPAPAGDAAGV